MRSLGAAMMLVALTGPAHAQSTIHELGHSSESPSPPPPVQPVTPPPPTLTSAPPPPPEPSLPPPPTVKLIGAPQTSGSPFRRVELPKGVTFERLPGASPMPRAGLGQVVTEIKIVDNVKTDSNTIEYLSGLQIGDVLDGTLLEQARVRLLSSGLFKEVQLRVEASSQNGARVVISAKDKLSWVIAPIAAASDGNYGGGLVFAHGNLFGQNKKLLVYTDYTTTEKLLFLAFLDPNVRNTRFYYRVDLLIRGDTIREYARGHDGDPRIERQTDVDTFGAAALAGINFTRKLHMDLRLKIYYDKVGAPSCYNTTNEDGSGTPDVVAAQGGSCRAPSASAWDNTLTTSLAYDGRSKVDGILDGLYLSLTWQYGAGWLGTGNDYHLVNFQGMFAKRFFKEHNLIVRLGADVDFDPPFKMEVEAGGPQMRGFLVRQYRGDTSVRGTLEYIVPLFTVLGVSFRAIGFYDTNLTWFRDLPSQSDGPTARLVRRDGNFRDFLPDTPSGLVRDSWHNGIGAGLRLYMRGIVLPLLGVDFAYGFESNAFQWYISIGSTLD